MDTMLARLSSSKVQVYMADETDLLSFIRAISHGDKRVAGKWYYRTSSPLSSFLADAMLDLCEDFGANKFGIIKTLDFFTNFWVLAYRQRCVSTDSTASLRSTYEQLQSFHSDQRRAILELW